jgi:hypothetical protein
MILLLIIGFAILIYACALWVKLVWWIFTPKKKAVNPYIEAQKTIMDNDKNYDEYLDWLKVNGSGVPIDKIKHSKEIEIENEYKKLIGR